jgi:hypothetical protein
LIISAIIAIHVSAGGATTQWRYYYPDTSELIKSALAQSLEQSTPRLRG